MLIRLFLLMARNKVGGQVEKSDFITWLMPQPLMWDSKMKNIEMAINASGVLDMLGPLQCGRNDISPNHKCLKICNYSTVRLLPLLFRCGWLKRVAEIEIKRMEERVEGGREGCREGGAVWDADSCPNQAASQDVRATAAPWRQLR